LLGRGPPHRRPPGVRLPGWPADLSDHGQARPAFRNQGINSSSTLPSYAFCQGRPAFRRGSILFSGALRRYPRQSKKRSTHAGCFP